MEKGVWPVSDWPGGARKWLCVCMTCGSFVTPTYNNVMRPGRGGCTHCARKAAAARRRLSAAEAVDIMRAAGVEPLEDYPGVDAPWKCRCLNPECPGVWNGEPADIRPRLSDVRVSKRSACKYCARRAVRPERATRQMIERGVLPVEEYPGALKPWKCRCLACGALITPRYANVVLNGAGGCAFCANRVRVPDSVAIEEMRAAGAEPLDPYPGVNTRWCCRCLNPDCGQEIHPRLGTVRTGSRPCKWCAGTVTDPRTASDYMVTFGGVEPLEAYPGARTPWRCRCLTCKRTVTPTLGSVKGGRSGCRHCAVGAVRTDKEAREYACARGFIPDPEIPYRTSRTPWPGICRVCEAPCSPRLDNLHRQGPCRNCADFGFNTSAPSVVYLVVHPKLRVAKVGVCNIGTPRLQQHQREGWEVHETVHLPMGWQALLVEQAVLAVWRKERGWPPALTAADMPQAGYTETVALAHAPVETLWLDVLQACSQVLHGGRPEGDQPAA